MKFYLEVALFGFLFFFACAAPDKGSRDSSPIENLSFDSKSNLEDSLQVSGLFNGNYDVTFNDLHDLHIKSATKLGFAAMQVHGDTSRIKGRIEYRRAGEYTNYVVDSLPHSLPIIIPAVSELIDDIGRDFRDSLQVINYPDCKIVVTSLTRTEEDIKQLRRKNRNSIEESAHRFGTTFDISWIHYHQVDTLDTRIAYDRVLKKTLAKVLYNLQQQKRCYIKHENQQMCFHITVRNDD